MLQKLVRAATNAASSSSASSSRGTVLSVIAADVRIVGDIMTQGEIHIDGQVEGDITCSELVIGEGARISGEVTAERIKVHGELTGKMNSTVISIARSARVVGDLTHDSLEIEAGAHVEGHCIRKGVVAKPEPKRIEAQPAEAAPPAPAAQQHAGKGAKAAEHAGG